MSNKFGVGMRFKMRFEGDDSPERRFSGTIVGVDDTCSNWENSKWRSLKVQWDEPASVPRPERVSPWEIEPFAPSMLTSIASPPTLKHKRPRPHVEITISDNQTSSSSAARNLPHEGNKANHGASSVAESDTNMTAEEAEESKTASAWSVISNCSPPSCVIQNNSLISSQNDRKSDPSSTCRLFGIDLKSPSTLPLTENPPMISDDNSQLKPRKDSETRHVHSSRSRTKVQMQGVAVGRAVDLTMLKGYNELITELEELFTIQGELRPRDKWEVVFTDNEGDVMLMGDDPWPEFVSMVRRILICQGVKKMKGSKLCEGNTLNLQNVGD